MTSHEIKNNNNGLWRTIIISISIIIIIGLLLGFGLPYSFKFYNARLDNQSKVEAREKFTTETVETKEEEIKAESVAKETTTSVETTIQEVTVVETAVVDEKATEDTFDKVAAEDEIPDYYETKGGVPDNGTEWNCDVSWDELEIFTCGPANILSISLKGGEKQGSVIIMKGNGQKGTNKTSYTISGLIAGAGWHGNKFYGRAITEKDLNAIVDLKVQEMMSPPNGSDRMGCNVVDVIIVDGDQIIYQKTFEKQ